MCRPDYTFYLQGHSSVKEDKETGFFFAFLWKSFERVDGGGGGWCWGDGKLWRFQQESWQKGEQVRTEVTAIVLG